MPDPKYSPSNPLYYEQPDIYPEVDKLLGDSYRPENEEEMAVYNQSRENMEAFFRSRLMIPVETPEQIREVFGHLPGYRAEDPQRDARRLLSAQAREALVKLAMDFRYSVREESLGDRNFYILCQRKDTPEAHSYNENIAKRLATAGPKERGEMFDELIRNTYPLYKKCINGELSDRDLIENLSDLQKVQDVAVNAPNILELLTGNDKKRIEVAPDTLQILHDMNDNYVAVNLLMHRVRAIANPAYEFVDIDSVRYVSLEDFEAMENRVEGEYPGMHDYIKALGGVRGQEMLVRELDKNTMKDSLGEVEEANKGFFIGSRAYSRAMRAMRRLDKLVDQAGMFPSEADTEKQKAMLEDAISKCGAYLASKTPGRFKNAREERRYNAMVRAMKDRQKTLDNMNLPEKVKKAEALNFRRPNVEHPYPVHPVKDVLKKIQERYGVNYYQVGKELKTTAIPPSDVGPALDNLRIDIDSQLREIVQDDKKFEPNLVRTLMASMVVLEMAKSGRETNVLGTIFAGDVEKSLAINPAKMILTIQGNPYFTRMTQNVTPEMLRHFVMNNGAKTIADTMERMATGGKASIGNREVPQSQKAPVVNSGGIKENPYV